MAREPGSPCRVRFEPMTAVSFNSLTVSRLRRRYGSARSVMSARGERLGTRVRGWLGLQRS